MAPPPQFGKFTAVACVFALVVISRQVGRLHHRSGIYGVVSPRVTGSNFFGVGLRFDLN